MPVCGYSMLRCHLFSIGKSVSDRCRFGCNDRESLEHVLLECPKCNVIRKKVCLVCQENGLDITIINLMCNPIVHLLTEKFSLIFTDKREL